MLPVNTVAVYGIKPTLEVLRLVEPDLYKSVQKEIAGTAQFLVVQVKNKFPNEPWDSSKPINWTRYGRTRRGKKPDNDTGASFPRYKIADVRKGVKAKVGGRKNRTTGVYPILTIQQTNAGGMIYDLAKHSRTKGKESFVKNLKTMGEPSRVMWPTVEKYKSNVHSDVMRIVNRVQKQFETQIELESQRRANASIRASQQTRNALGQFGKAMF
jgi:hypothetical protein